MKSICARPPFLSMIIGLTALFSLVMLAVAASQIDIIGPPGSGRFGTTVSVLPNGNIVVTDPDYYAGSIADVGAVYLYDGATGALISTLTGSTANDRVGDGGVIVVGTSDFVVRSPFWDNGAAWDAGAITWGSGTSGVSGEVSAANSLVGSTAGDSIGNFGVVNLANGNYVVQSPSWDNNLLEDAGAVTWGRGTTGIRGAVSAANSLVGSATGDRVGGRNDSVVVLANGNYVVLSPFWDHGATAEAGAVTWGSGSSGVSGAISQANSLVGSSQFDSVGGFGVTALANGNYLVSSGYWDNGLTVNAGAVTWGSGVTGITGAVGPANSLVGSTDYDQVGYFDVTTLSNGNYVVNSPMWDNGAVTDAGAVTWGSGTAGITGEVSAANSLVGTGDQAVAVHTFANGNYVVINPGWDNGSAIDAGAVTWGSGTAGVSGVVSEANSLVGSASGDQIGLNGVTGLANGNYVISSSLWDNGALTNVGAVTWGSGESGIRGVVSAANSLVGMSGGDMAGSHGVTALTNGSYVVISPNWDNGAALGAGAATWGDGATGIRGVISASNSLVGGTSGDQIGWDYPGVVALTNGNYVVRSPFWDNGAAVDAGAVTWGSGTGGVSGVVSAANSLVGATSGDQIGWDYPGVVALTNGNYVVRSPYWDNGAVVDVGAATWGNGASGIIGVVSAENSLVGSHNNDWLGISGVKALTNGNYVVSSRYWDYGVITDTGAVTWGNGISGVSGAASPANSLIGSSGNDEIGDFTGATALENGDYVLVSPRWDNGAAWDVGAVTLGDGATGRTRGPVGATNSVLGSAVDRGYTLVWVYDDLNMQLVVSRRADNIVSLFRLSQLPYHTYLPLVASP